MTRVYIDCGPGIGGICFMRRWSSIIRQMGMTVVSDDEDLIIHRVRHYDDHCRMDRRSRVPVLGIIDSMSQRCVQSSLDIDRCDHVISAYDDDSVSSGSEYGMTCPSMLDMSPESKRQGTLVVVDVDGECTDDVIEIVNKYRSFTDVSVLSSDESLSVGVPMLSSVDEIAGYDMCLPMRASGDVDLNISFWECWRARSLILSEHTRPSILSWRHMIGGVMDLLDVIEGYSSIGARLIAMQTFVGRNVARSRQYRLRRDLTPIISNLVGYISPNPESES